jgi:hypothetical protein
VNLGDRRWWKPTTIDKDATTPIENQCSLSVAERRIPANLQNKKNGKRNENRKTGTSKAERGNA